MTNEKEFGHVVENDLMIVNAEDLMHLQAEESSLIEHSAICRGQASSTTTAPA